MLREEVLHEERAEETGIVQGDPADSRREGIVPDRRWRAERLQRAAEGRTE